MSLLFMDSFDHYATADLAEKWTALTGTVAIGAYGRNSTNGLRIPSNTSPASVQASVLGGIASALIGFGIKISAAPASGFVPFIAFGSSGTWECGLAINADLTVQPCVATSAAAALGSSTNWSLLGSASSALSTGAWTFLELKMACDGAAGTCVVRATGTTILDLSGLDTLYTSATLTRVGIGGATSAAFAFDADDLYVASLTGGSVVDFTGDVTVTAHYPSGPGTTSGWTPSAGSNYQNVDETPANDDTDYNATATLNAKDTYAMQDCAAGADIRAVQILASVRKGAEGPGQVKLVTRSASTDYDGAAQGIGGTSYSYVREIRETDPATAAAWSESGWNSVEIGLKKTG